MQPTEISAKNDKALKIFLKDCPFLELTEATTLNLCKRFETDTETIRAALSEERTYREERKRQEQNGGGKQ